MLRNIAIKGNFLCSINSSHVLALFPLALSRVSHVSGTGSFMRFPARSRSKFPDSPDLAKSSGVLGYFLPRIHITLDAGVDI